MDRILRVVGAGRIGVSSPAVKAPAPASDSGTVLTPDQPRPRTARAVRAATEAGRDLGLDVAEPAVLHDAFSVVVHLAPSPVAVRVPMVLPPDLRDGRLVARQQRELDVVHWLAEQGFPVIPPSPLVPLAPVSHDGLSMTFWELADVAPDHAPYGAVDGARVVELHVALRDYPAADGLPFLAPVNHSVPSLLALLLSPERTPDLPALLTPADEERARREWESLEPVLGSRAGFEARFPHVPLQAVHGDGPSYNTIRTTKGVLFADFEDVCLAPIEWDLALTTPADVESYDRGARERGERATDPEVLRLMSAARMLQMVGSVALVPEMPMLARGLAPVIEAWRRMPPLP